MEILALVFIWPIIIFALGLTFIAFGDLLSGAHEGFFVIGMLFSWILPLLLIVGLYQIFKKPKPGEQKENPLNKLRKFCIGLSLALLFPLVSKYLIEAMDNSLASIIISLILGFVLVVVGMFMKKNHVLIYSNIVGGALILIYTYGQLWELGQGARVIAAAFGLIVAVAVSIIKLKDKLK